MEFPHRAIDHEVNTLSYSSARLQRRGSISPPPLCRQLCLNFANHSQSSTAGELSFLHTPPLIELYPLSLPTLARQRQYGATIALGRSPPNSARTQDTCRKRCCNWQLRLWTGKGRKRLGWQNNETSQVQSQPSHLLFKTLFC